MTDNMKDKARFFAQYFMQKVLRNKQAPNKIGLNTCQSSSKAIFECEYLELTALSSITDEHAIELCKLLNLSKKWQETVGEEVLLREGKKDAMLISKSINPTAVQLSACSRVIDYLRKHGYLVPFDGYSCEELIEKGWAKLKDNG